MSGRISGHGSYKLNIKSSRSPWWMTLPVSQRVTLLRKVALMLSSVSDLQQFLHQQMTLSPEYERSKLSSSVRQMVDLLSLSVGKAVRNYVVRLEVDTASLVRKKGRSSRSRTKTSRKGTRMS